MKNTPQRTLHVLLDLAEKKATSNLGKKRLQTELRWVEKRGYAPLFLHWVRKIEAQKTRQVLIGPGRGAIGGCYLAWCLGLTKINPLSFGLSPKLFLRDDRETLPFCFDVSTKPSAAQQHFYYDETLGQIARAKAIVGEPSRANNVLETAVLKRLRSEWHLLDRGVPKEVTDMLKKLPKKSKYPLELSLALSRPGPMNSGMTSAYFAESANSTLKRIWPETRGVPIFREQWHQLTPKQRSNSLFGESRNRWGRYGYLRSHAIGRGRIGQMAAEIAIGAPSAWLEAAKNKNPNAEDKA